jgi:(2Fe-2S) ferredoxin
MFVDSFQASISPSAGKVYIETDFLGAQSHSRILISNSSFQPSMISAFDSRSVSLLRSGRHIEIPGDHSVASFVEAFFSTEHGSTSKDSFNSSEVSEVTVLICGHNSRDKRCGVMGPLLQAEFEEKLRMFGVCVLEEPPGSLHSMQNAPPEYRKTGVRARVGLVSHVGGHAFAGNVIIYLPRTAQTHPLVGLGVWYGRVQPRHVEGIIQQTILGGNLIEELLRGTVLPTASQG